MRNPIICQRIKYVIGMILHCRNTRQWGSMRRYERTLRFWLPLRNQSNRYVIDLLAQIAEI